MKKIFKISLLLLLTILLVVFSFLLYLSIATKNVKFKKEYLNKKFTFTQFYDINNNLIEFQNNEVNYTSNIPNHVKNAFISVEDKRFYSHNGIDYIRLIKAMLVNVKNFSFSQGASTISQQLIKNTHLSNEKTIKRKFIEIKLTKELEKFYTKEEILLFYLNNIYFGENAYGISNASKLYFNKKVEELNVSEAALLAGIVKAPSIYNPIKNPKYALKRKDLVLKLMKKNNFIDENIYQSELNREISFNNEFKTQVNKYTTEIFDELKTILNTPYVNKNYKVYTYLDLDLQKQIENISIEENCEKKYIIIDNKTMGVKAYYSTCQNLLRQPASTIKPLLVYGPAYNEKIVNLQTKILDNKTNFNGYIPKNFNDKYYGYISCKDALSKSLNVPSVKLLNSIGLNKIKKYSKKFNIEINNENLSLALGNLESGISLKHLTSCYSTFVNDGNYSTCAFIKEIKNEKGKTIYKHFNKKTNVFSKESSYIINYNLMDCVKNGTGKKIADLPYQICAKTGTNGNKNGNIDAYSISYTTNHTVGIWLGAKNNQFLSNNCTGSSHPTIIAKNIYKILYKDNQPNKFIKPDNVLTIKYDKDRYDKNYEIVLSENDNYYEGLFIKGTEPKNEKKYNSLPFIKHCKIVDNKKYFSVIYDYYNCDGIELYELINNKEIYIKRIRNNKINISPTIGSHRYFLKPYKHQKGKIIYGENYYLPVIDVKNELLPKEWWEN